jgi:hypothetical protein
MDPEAAALGMVGPKEIQPYQVSGDLWRIMEFYLDRVNTAVGRTDAEAGNNAAGVSSGSHLQLLAEESAEQRASRLERIRVWLEQLYNWGVQQLAEKVREPRKLWTTDDAGHWQQKVWSGEDFHGQTTVKVKPAAAYETAVTQRENMRLAVGEMKSLTMEDPKTRRLVNEALNLPSEVTAAANIGIEQAKREWQELTEEPFKEPFVDAEMEAHADHADQHATDMDREKWHDLEDDAQAYLYLPLIENWDKPGEPTPVLGPNGQQIPIPDPMTGGQTQAVDPNTGQPAFQMEVLTPMQKTERAMAIPRADGTAVTWPEMQELQIFETLRMLVGADKEEGEAWPAGKPGDPRDMKVPLQRWIRGRAHRMSHRIFAEGEQMQAASGQPQLAAPDTAQTTSGMMAGPGAGPMPMPPPPPQPTQEPAGMVG